MTPVEVRVFGPRGKEYETRLKVVCNRHPHSGVLYSPIGKSTPETLQTGLKIAKKYSDEEGCDIALEILLLKGQKKSLRR